MVTQHTAEHPPPISRRRVVRRHRSGERPRKGNLYRKNARTGALLVLPALLVVLGFYIFPATFNLFLSMRDVTVFTMHQGGDGWVGWNNFVRLFTTENIAGILWNTTFWLTFVTVLVRMVLGLALALVLNATIMRRRGVGPLSRTLMILPWTVPPVAAVLIWQFLLQPNYGAFNQVLAAIGVLPEGGIGWIQQLETVWAGIGMIVVWRELPLVVLMLLAGLQTIDPDIYDAAKADGAGFMRTLFSVTLPMIKPVVVVTALLTIIWTYNNFVYVWLTTRGGPGNSTQVLATSIFKQGFVEYDIALSSATAVLGMLIMAVFAIVYFLKTFKVNDD